MTSDHPPTSHPPGFESLTGRRSFGLKLLLVCALALMMAIPALFVYSVVYDRTLRQNAAITDVSERYGGPQAVMGPFISLPYAVTRTSGDDTQTEYGIVVLYPETGEVDAVIDTQERRRGIHVVPVFEADITHTARFDPARIGQTVPRGASVFWEDAYLYTGLSETRTMTEATELVLDGTRLEVEPITDTASGSGYRRVPNHSGDLVGSRLEGFEARTAPFEVTAKLRFTGAQSFSALPFARDTRVNLSSDWPDPSFSGGYQPGSYTPESAAGEGFSASWNVPYEARGIPGAGLNLAIPSGLSNQSLMRTGFLKTNSPYQSVQRALKYALMFIGFVFLAYFLFEIASAQRAHPAQYVLVGLAQSVFYLMLLALSERLGFDLAFLIAASLTVLLTAGYAASVFGSRRYGLFALATLTGVYALIYMLMRLDDYALLVGALTSFTAIALTMWMTRNVNWYGMTDSQAR